MGREAGGRVSGEGGLVGRRVSGDAGRRVSGDAGRRVSGEGGG